MIVIYGSLTGGNSRLYAVAFPSGVDVRVRSETSNQCYLDNTPAPLPLTTRIFLLEKIWINAWDSPTDDIPPRSLV